MIKGLIFVCLFLFTNVVVVVIFLFPTCDCLNAKGEENLPQFLHDPPLYMAHLSIAKNLKTKRII